MTKRNHALDSQLVRFARSGEVALSARAMASAALAQPAKDVLENRQIRTKLEEALDMMKLFRLIGLVSQSSLLLVIHVVGVVAIALGFAIGWYRQRSWLVPIVAVVMGVVTDIAAKSGYLDIGDVSGLLEKASAANERGGFLILVYFALTAISYVIGAYARHNLELRKKAPAAAAPPEAKKPEPKKPENGKK